MHVKRRQMLGGMLAASALAAAGCGRPQPAAAPPAAGGGHDRAARYAAFSSVAGAALEFGVGIGRWRKDGGADCLLLPLFRRDAAAGGARRDPLLRQTAALVRIRGR